MEEEICEELKAKFQNAFIVKEMEPQLQPEWDGRVVLKSIKRCDRSKLMKERSPYKAHPWKTLKSLYGIYAHKGTKPI